jgi:hypothetical protein
MIYPVDNFIQCFEQQGPDDRKHTEDTSTSSLHKRACGIVMKFSSSISKIAFLLFGNRLHITGTKINRQILNTNVNK